MSIMALTEDTIDTHYTLADIFRSFAAVKMIYTLSGPIMSDIPKDVRLLSEKTGFSLEAIHTT